MSSTPYEHLALALDALPNGFPPAVDGSHLRLLQKLFTPEQAALAASLSDRFETVDQIAQRLGRGREELRDALKAMSRRGLIEAGHTEQGLGFRLLPFVVGIYEMQVASMDAELARLFEDYFRQAFGRTLQLRPQFHRVIPVLESVRQDMQIAPFEDARALVDGARAWGVLDCICRKQQRLLGSGCDHPLDVCMVLSDRPGAYDGNPVIRALDRKQALAVLQRAAAAGLVHSVSNTRDGVTYICNCCTCACGILRGMKALGIADVVARSPFVNTVDAAVCSACGDCVPACQFDALRLEDYAVVDAARCVGCGVCVPLCSTGALRLVRRPAEEVPAIPATPEEWGARRREMRGLPPGV